VLDGFLAGYELMQVLAGAGDAIRQSAGIAIEAVTGSVSAHMAPTEAAGLRLFDIVDLSHYSSTASQVDLVFVNPEVVDPPALKPWRRRTFGYDAGYPLTQPPPPPPLHRPGG
jgi:hypothetical protein